MTTGVLPLFQGGKRKALTLSYDDGTIHDRKLVELLNHYNVKCTFNLNSGLFGREERKVVGGYDTDFSRIEESEVAKLYQGHEIATHSVNHLNLTAISDIQVRNEVLEDKAALERICKKDVRGFAYPYGAYNEHVEELLSDCGIEYARTVVSTNGFDIPQDFLEWHPTCHHDSEKLMSLAEAFCTEKHTGAELFYLWGHSYEFSQKDNWEVMENFLKYVSQYRDQIWFATNLEIMDYITDYRKIECSSDGTWFRNPTNRTLWFEANRKVHQILPNEKYGPV